MSDATEFAPPCSGCQFYRKVLMSPIDSLSLKPGSIAPMTAITIVVETTRFPECAIGLCLQPWVPMTSAEMRAFGGDCGPMANLYRKRS